MDGQHMGRHHDGVLSLHLIGQLLLQRVPPEDFPFRKLLTCHAMDSAVARPGGQEPMQESWSRNSRTPPAEAAGNARERGGGGPRHRLFRCFAVPGCPTVAAAYQ